MSLAITAYAQAGQSIDNRQPAITARNPSACVVPACEVASNVQPTGGRVVAGKGSISESGNSTTIQQSSADLTIDWLSFSIGSQETVNFLQPSASAIAVNQIFSTSGSQILGHLDANGQVWLINPNGVLFGRGAQVNVGGLVASTLSSLSSGGSTTGFSGSGPGSIVNQGTINAANGGYVALLGNQVGNQGTITAKLGTVALGAGNAATLSFSGNSLVKMQVDQSTLNSVAQNGGLIRADGGMVIMSAGAKDALLASVVNNTGVIEARTVENHDGTIELLGGMTAGAVDVGGTLDASAPDGGNGGSVETNAAHVVIADGARVTTLADRGKTGTWLIDPTDFTVAPSGGDLTGATLGSNLNSTNTTILSSNGASSVTGGGSGGNININDTVSWSANTTLTLTAANNVNVNANMTATGNSAGLMINPNTANTGSQGSEAASGSGAFNLAMGNSITLSGTNPSLSIGGQAYTVINSLGAAGSITGTDLQGINGNLAGYYALGSNINAAATSSWNGGEGFTPLGNSTTNFTGSFNGLGHTISGLTIDMPSANYVGLFGDAYPVSSSSAIRNVGLVGGSIIGDVFVGALVGGNTVTVSNSYATATVTGTQNVGGLVGSNNQGSVANSYATGNVSGSSLVGGLVGQNSGTVTNSYATGSVSGGSNAIDVGGLVGVIDAEGTVANSYATGSVSGTTNVGGLVGNNIDTYSVYSILNSYATGSVTGSSYVGGLAGSNEGIIQTTYATGPVSGSTNVGGLLGANIGGGSVTDGFWNTTTSGHSTSAGGTGLTTAQMQSASNFTGFTFTTTPGASGDWVIVDANGTLNNASGAAGATFPMLASEYSTTINNAHQLQLMAMNLTASYTLGQNVNATATSSGGDVWGSAGFVPIGSSTSNFTGSFNGLGNTITNLAIDMPSSSDVGLFGYTGAGSVIQKVGLVGGYVEGASAVGNLVGYSQGTVSNSYATGTVDLIGSSSGAGGLVGNNVGTIQNSYAAGLVDVGYGSDAGGLAGFNSGTIKNSYATGEVYGYTSCPFSCYAPGYLGGLVGNNGGTVTNSYATGFVEGTGYYSYTYYYSCGLSTCEGTAYQGAFDVGGLVGISSAAINNSYATGGVSTSSYAYYVGGLVGYNAGGTISNTYSAGSVSVGSSSNEVGGLVGANGGTVSNSFWDTTTSGQSSSAAGTGMTTAQMEMQANFTSATGANGNVNPGWDFSGTWVMYNGYTFPLLRSFMTPLTVTANNAATTYDQQPYSGGNGVSYSITPNGNLLGTVSYGGTSQGAINAGSYAIAPSGLYSNQQGYIISYANGTLTVNPLALTGATIAAGSSVYGSAVTPGTVSFSNLLPGDSVSATVSIADSIFSTSGHLDAGSYAQTASATLSGASASNYTFTGYTTPTSNYTVTQLALTGASIASGSSTYGSTVTPGAVSFANVVSGDIVGSMASIVSPAYSTSGHLDAGSYAQAASGLAGADAGNYSFGGYATPTSNYTVGQLALTGASIAAGSSTYGSAVTPGAVSFANVISGDLVGSTASIVSPAYSTSGHLDAGGYAQAASGLIGTDAGNYSFNGYITPTSNYTVGQLALTGASIAAANSTYGSAVAPGAVSFANVVSGDIVGSTASIVSPAYSTSGHLDAGSYAQAASGLAGADAGNYSFGGYTTSTNTYTVGQLALTGASIAAANSTYGSAVASGAVSFANVVSGDVVGSTASIVSPAYSSGGHLDAGSYAQAASGLVGADAGNYSFNGYTTPTNNYTVSQLALTISGLTATASRVYNGGTTDGLHGTASIAPVSGDAVLLSGTGSASFASANVGADLPLTVSGYRLTGADAGNYLLVEPTGLTANITRLGSVAWVGGTSGNWSLASNWAGGAIPDYANVGAVTIPANDTVTYDSGVPGATMLATLTSSGNLVMAAGSLSTTGNFSTAGYTQSGGTLNVGKVLTISSVGDGVTLGNITAGSLSVDSQAGAITQMAATTLDVKGVSDLIANNGLTGAGAVSYAITLGNTTNIFKGAVSANGADIDLFQGSGALSLGNIIATGTLTAMTERGAITQSASTAVDVDGATNLTAVNLGSSAGVANITLTSGTNDLVGPVAATGLNIDLVNTSPGGLILGSTTAGGTLALTSEGPIGQSASTAVNVTGATSLTAGDYAITLANTANSFRGAVSSSGSNIELADGNTGGLKLGNTTANGSLTVDSMAGPITQAASTAISVAGASSLTASDGITGPGAVEYGITLAGTNNNFEGAVAANGSAITLDDAGALTAILDSTGASSLTSVGALSVSGTVGTSLTTKTTGTNAATTFGATTVGTKLVVTSTGAVTEATPDALTVDGKGTTTVSNANVTVNGVKGAEIP